MLLPLSRQNEFLHFVENDGINASGNERSEYF